MTTRFSKLAAGSGTGASTRFSKLAAQTGGYTSQPAKLPEALIPEAMFDFDLLEQGDEEEAAKVDKSVHAGSVATSLAQAPGSSESVPREPQKERKFQQQIANEKKVRIVGLKMKDAEKFNGRNGQVMSFDPSTGRYAVKVIVLDTAEIGLRSGKVTLIHLKYENMELHRDQMERDKIINGDEMVLLGAGDAKKQLYSVQLDPQYWYDKAIERVFQAKNDFEVLDLPVQLTEDTAILKRQYRKISLAVHPDKNKHPQAADAFRKTYGAFETLMDIKQQRRMLWIMGKLDKSMDDQVTLDEEEEDELFQWWWEATVPQIEKTAAEADGQWFDEFGAMWISDGLGGNVEDVKWVGLETAKKLHADDAAIFIDCRDRPEFICAHIQGAWCCPLPEFLDYGVAATMGDELVMKVLENRKIPLIIYSEVATPFSRCRALCRWLLRAGHRSLKAERLRRLRGGIFGWSNKQGPVSRPLMDASQEATQEHHSSLASVLYFQGMSGLATATQGVEQFEAD
eukprot:gnl/TRDRNA2_/TRDRNA2_40221_c0_seq1.p1 gnl/TRDRNA2_/TRDRNA2_40221_c0~~gnl/TRDRNA2_/TRDRNA2_40221_c0_seq1.p1  ORF type:complete len:512 (+),score=123.30 gnl/TRDRNA2_/TRDRNA2_40221_c0_seq1:80-1615(+)